MDHHTFSDWIFTKDADMEKVVLSTVRGDYSLTDIQQMRDSYIHMINGIGDIKGKKVALLVPSVETYIALSLAVNQLGGAIIPLSWQLRHDDLSAVLDSLTPHLVFSVCEFNGFNFEKIMKCWAEKTGKECYLFFTKDNQQWNSHLTEGEVNPNELEQIDVIGCSSGSTGVPKGIILNRDSLIFWLSQMKDYSDLNKEDVVYITIPPTAPWGFAWLLLGFKENSHVVFPDSFDPIQLVNLFDKKGCNKMFCTPSIFKAIHKLGKVIKPNMFQHLERVGLGGEVITEDFIELAKSMTTVRFTNIYGSSEAGPILFNDDIRNEGMSMLKGIDYKVKPLEEQADTGELLMRSQGVFAGYYQRQDLTSDILKKEWFSTGDIVKQLSDSKYLIIERMKNMIKKAGQAVIPGEVEYVLSQHPNVKQATVIGMPHPVYGEQVIAFVVTEGELEEHELYSFTSKKIATYKVPDRIIKVPAIPIIQGKVDRITLKRIITA